MKNASAVGLRTHRAGTHWRTSRQWHAAPLK